MKRFLLITVLIMIFRTMSLMAQDADTIRSEEIPVCLNLAEVKRSMVYPEEAKIDSIEGRVVIKLLVKENGDVEKTGMITGPEVFYEEVRRAGIKLKFSPGKVNGWPVKVWVPVPFVFQLRNK